MALQQWETLTEVITAYTGLSPTAFFTILVLAVAVYHFVSGFFVFPHDHRKVEEYQVIEPPSTPVQVGEITEEDLKQYDGSDRKKPLLMAIKGQIYDVSQSRMFYGPGGPYALFAGKDASRALAKMSFDEQDLTGDISGLGPFELEALEDWEYKFMSKYTKVGTLKRNDPEGEAVITSTPKVRSVLGDNDVADSTESAPKITDDAQKSSDDTQPADNAGDIQGDDSNAAENVSNIQKQG